MIGYEKNWGIVPIATDELFERVRATTTEDKWYDVSCSMVEIYNECVQDLMIDLSSWPPGGLKIWESKLLGIYVQDLSKHKVDSYEQIEALMAEGYKNRSIGSTQMNKTSSWAHTIITITF